ncbi:MAG: CooT family nickel-binding protein [Candidatus Bathyarchaeia archaeon]
MCLLKVYVTDEKTGDRKLIAENVALVSMENGYVRLLDVEAKEKVLSKAEFLLADALNSILILRSHGDS